MLRRRLDPHIHGLAELGVEIEINGRFEMRAPRLRGKSIFLDEALIKADAHFTKRAIGAWRGLGFQLVIGAPNDKYSAIEPHVDV